jgi:CDP-diacylglycerol--glycerol-3-phosphate 3-phosphatidyltransferase
MISNFVTLSRILVAPLFAYAFIIGFDRPHQAVWQWAGLAILILIELSDALDGRIARARKEVSDFGKFFDPLADSLSRLTVFCAFLVTGVIPLWMFLIFLYRDIFVSAIRYLCIKQGVVVPARVSGKLKAIFQGAGSFGVVLVTLSASLGMAIFPQTVAGKHPGYFFMLFPALFTAYSAVDYWWGNRAVFAGKPAASRQS